jgi:hypothetical protein
LPKRPLNVIHNYFGHFSQCSNYISRWQYSERLCVYLNSDKKNFKTKLFASFPRAHQNIIRFCQHFTIIIILLFSCQEIRYLNSNAGFHSHGNTKRLVISWDIYILWHQPHTTIKRVYQFNWIRISCMVARLMDADANDEICQKINTRTLDSS